MSRIAERWFLRKDFDTGSSSSESSDIGKELALFEGVSFARLFFVLILTSLLSSSSLIEVNRLPLVPSPLTMRFANTSNSVRWFLSFFALFSHAHRLCCSFVFCAWHRRHKVRMLSTVHSPPPSFTARIWSASHADPSYASLANLSVCARVNCGAKLSIIGKRWCGFKHLMRETNAWQSSLHFSHTPRSRSKTAMRNVFPDLDCTWYSKQSFEQKRSCKESGCCSCC
mmetsp:Transcript_62/g.169  ORF Transcript_62/g.169 Transcript_62/m.169 type:complete len:227 (+) Transcript_62:373-1053(+)